MKEKNKFVLILGSNIGDRDLYLTRAQESLKLAGIKIIKTTKSVSTVPALVHQQDFFKNQGLFIGTDNSPEKLLELIKNIEKKLGRVFVQRYGPRCIDIDIAWWNRGRFKSEKLNLPHPANKCRPWVRSVLSELLGEQLDPEIQVPYRSLNVMPIQKLDDFLEKKKKGEKISLLTAYDYSFAKVLAQTSLDSVLVGDSLGNVMQGYESTIPVTVDQMIYHAKAVRKAMPDHFLIVDMPFMAAQSGRKWGIKTASKIMQKSECNALKIEGAQPKVLKLIIDLTNSGIPVMGHLGLTPQSVQKLGGYRLQAKSLEEQSELIKSSMSLQQAGAFALVLEMVPAKVAGQIAKELSIPVIGIGAGHDVDGQVLVLQDMLGMNPDFNPKFVRKFINLSSQVEKATEEFCEAVRKSSFPSSDESFS